MEFNGRIVEKSQEKIKKKCGEKEKPRFFEFFCLNLE
jgi:hypothetical protein